MPIKDFDPVKSSVEDSQPIKAYDIGSDEATVEVLEAFTPVEAVGTPGGINFDLFAVMGGEGSASLAGRLPLLQHNDAATDDFDTSMGLSPNDLDWGGL